MSFISHGIHWWRGVCEGLCYSHPLVLQPRRLWATYDSHSTVNYSSQGPGGKFFLPSHAFKFRPLVSLPWDLPPGASFLVLVINHAVPPLPSGWTTVESSTEHAVVTLPLWSDLHSAVMLNLSECFFVAYSFFPLSHITKRPFYQTYESASLAIPS